MVVGDFNETMWGFEHFSVNQRPEHKMEVFREVLSLCDLHDLGFCGLPFTWDNGHSSSANVRVRLDMAVADPAWRDLFFYAKVHHLILSRSDHLLPVKTHRGAVSQQHEEPGSPRCRRWSLVTSELRPARLAHTRRDGSRACHLVCTWPGR
jgi:hypothetical protein